MCYATSSKTRWIEKIRSHVSKSIYIDIVLKYSVFSQNSYAFNEWFNNKVTDDKLLEVTVWRKLYFRQDYVLWEVFVVVI